MPYLRNYELPFSDQDTSRDAAVKAASWALNQRGIYYAWLQGKGAQGGTDAEAESEIPMRRSSVCARRNELHVSGHVVKSDRRRAGCAVYVTR